MQNNKKNTKVTPLLTNTVNTGYSYINYPNLDSAAQSETFANFNKFVSSYNENAKQLDKDVATYNSALVKCNEQELKSAKYFMKTRKTLPVEEYNAEVEAFNNMYKKILVAKKRPLKLTSGHINAFKALVSFQAGQLKASCNFKLKMDKTTRIERNNIAFTAARHELSNAKDQNGSYIYPVCKETVANHLKRLDELGVINVVFQGSNNPYFIQISPKILVVSDGNPPKRQNDENQLFNPPKAKNLQHKDITTRTLNNNRIKETETFSVILERSNINVAHNSFPAESYKITRGLSNQNFNTGGGIFYENFVQKIENPKELAQKLANNEFLDYQLPTPKYYRTIVNNTNISAEQMKQFIIQDLLKQASKIWKNHHKLNFYDKNATIGGWLNVMSDFNDYYLADQGSKLTYRKDHLLKLVEQFRWRISLASRIFSQKTDWIALFPAQYFDRTRKSPTDVAFQGTRFMWDRHIAKIQSKTSRTVNQKQAEAIRKLNLKYKNAIQKYVLGKKDLNWLISYTNSHLPAQYLQNLDKNIKEYQERINKKAA